MLDPFLAFFVDMKELLIRRTILPPDEEDIHILIPKDIGQSSTRTNRVGYSSSGTSGNGSQLTPGIIPNFITNEKIWWFYCGWIISQAHWFFACEYYNIEVTLPDEEYTSYLCFPDFNYFCLKQTGLYTVNLDTLPGKNLYLFYVTDTNSNIVDESLHQYLVDNIDKEVICYLACRPTRLGLPKWFR